MFIKNHTDRAITCRRGEVPETRGGRLRFATVMSVELYAQLPDGALRLLPEAPVAGDMRLAIDATGWDGTSVVATGWIPPPRSALAQRVRLSAGSVTRTVVARGARRWVWTGTALEPGRPEAWKPLEMRWEEAFGGELEIPAGRDARIGLPHSRYAAAYPHNPVGKGFAPDERGRHGAEGRELPRIELLEDQVTRFGQLPIPGCFAPCHELSVGMKAPLPDKHPVKEGSYTSSLPTYQVAPGYLVFPWLAPGTRLRLEGLERAIEALVPRPALDLGPRRPLRGERYGARLRAVRLDGDRGELAFIWQYAVVTRGASLPDLEIRWGRS